ncbi:MAG: GNAT family N-acetyltransferase [Acidimicrobiales bacterium]
MVPGDTAGVASEIRPVADDEFPAYTWTVQTAFGHHATEAETAGWRSITEIDRTLCVAEDGQIVATAGAFTFALSTPGGMSTPAAGVTAVGVLPTHRRRGLLRSLMARQLDDVVRAGEALAILTASESIIYGRFGYGVATSHASLAIDPRRSAYATPLEDAGRMEVLDDDSAARTVPSIHDRARRDQPGDVARSDAWWALQMSDPEWLRPGRPQKFWGLHRSASGEPDGYVSYRVAASWQDRLPGAEVEVLSLVGLDAAAELALWRFVLDLDLAGRVVAPSRPTDEFVRWRLADPRQLRVTAWSDHVWARMVDVPQALTARGYDEEDEIVMEVRDGFRPQSGGTFLLRTALSGADCTRTTRAPDLSIDVADLSAAYLGGSRLALLAGGGRVAEHRAGALRRADRLFAGATVPFCRSGF